MRYPMEAPGGCQTRRRAIGSAGERLVHTEEVTGSIPVSPTRSVAMSIFVEFDMGVIPVAAAADARVQMPVRWPSCDVLQAFTTNVITLLKNRGG